MKSITVSRANVGDLKWAAFFEDEIFDGAHYAHTCKCGRWTTGVGESYCVLCQLKETNKNGKKS